MKNQKKRKRGHPQNALMPIGLKACYQVSIQLHLYAREKQELSSTLFVLGAKVNVKLY